YKYAASVSDDGMMQILNRMIVLVKTIMAHNNGFFENFRNVANNIDDSLRVLAYSAGHFREKTYKQ
ncbi:MAG: hypothetical protein K6F51_11705, partial [Acetatifactor sp.]|nr:hypothetical protein [Acetatifactor sp.]